MLAAHQYLVARGQKGFVGPLGKADVDKQDYLRMLGNAIIKEFTKAQKDYEYGFKRTG